MRLGRPRSAGMLAVALLSPGCWVLTRAEIDEHDLGLAGPDADADADADTDADTDADGDTDVTDTDDTDDTDIPPSMCGTEALPKWPGKLSVLDVAGGQRLVTGSFAGVGLAGLAVQALKETYIGQAEPDDSGDIAFVGEGVAQNAPATDTSVVVSPETYLPGLSFVLHAESSTGSLTLIDNAMGARLSEYPILLATPTSAAGGNITGDELTDLVYVDGGTEEVWMVEDVTTGFTVRSLVGTDVDGGLVRLADLDGDGPAEIVSVDGLGRVRAWKATETGSLGNEFALVADVALVVPEAPAALVSGDFDGDGDTDLAAAFTAAGVIHVLLGDGTGGLSAGPRIKSVARPLDLVAVDLGSLGCASLVAVDSVLGQVVALQSQGDGSFAAPSEVVPFDFVETGDPISVGVADFDGAGALDVVVLTSNGSVYVSAGEK